MAHRIHIYNSITMDFIQAFCFINSACFHIYLLISCSQSQLQDTYNYFMFEETAPKRKRWRLLFTCPLFPALMSIKPLKLTQVFC